MGSRDNIYTSVVYMDSLNSVFLKYDFVIRYTIMILACVATRKNPKFASRAHFSDREDQACRAAK